MNLTIHHSASEIGGNCIEIESGVHRLILDIGQPLDKEGETAREKKLPATLDISKPVDGLIISHPHLDHFGLLSQVPQDWHVWSGKATEEIIRFNCKYSDKTLLREFRNFENKKPFIVGQFTVTPFLTDHSAFDAYMFLVEAEGKKLFYSGDFRMTGRKKYLVENIISRPHENIDALIIEGTNLGREDKKKYWDEERIEQEFINLIDSTKGRVFVTCSGQNIDRLVSIYKAAKKSGIPFIIDTYTAKVLSIVNKHCSSIPTADREEIKMLVSSRLHVKFDKMGDLVFIDNICDENKALSVKRLNIRKGKSVILIRDSMVSDFQKNGFHLSPDDAWCWSMWSDYQKKDSSRQITEWFASAGIKPQSIHTSGHASRSELHQLCDSINAAKNIIIHSDADDSIRREFKNPIIAINGETINI